MTEVVEQWVLPVWNMPGCPACVVGGVVRIPLSQQMTYVAC
jgi:hypothetical protein